MACVQPEGSWEILSERLWAWGTLCICVWLSHFSCTKSELQVRPRDLPGAQRQGWTVLAQPCSCPSPGWAGTLRQICLENSSLKEAVICGYWDCLWSMACGDAEPGWRHLKPWALFPFSGVIPIAGSHTFSYSQPLGEAPFEGPVLPVPFVWPIMNLSLSSHPSLFLPSLSLSMIGLLESKRHSGDSGISHCPILASSTLSTESFSCPIWNW